MPFAPLKIGNRSFSPVAGAPMAGVTDAPFRQIARAFGGELLFTEMVLAASLVHAHRQTREMAVCRDIDAPVAVQLEGTDPETMARAAQIVESTGGAAFIDINMGCPVPKIVKSGGGAALMTDPERAERIVRAMTDAVSLPVTVKFRLGWDAESENFLDFGKRMQDAGAAAATLHARTREQFYGGAADRSAFEKLKRALDIPVIANGDVRTPADAREVLEQTGADAVMIGRGMLGKPWILAQCAAVLDGRTPIAAPDAGKTALSHFDLMEKYYGRKAIFIARKHIAWYSAGKEGGADFRKAVNETDDPARLRDLIRGFFNAE